MASLFITRINSLCRITTCKFKQLPFFLIADHRKKPEMNTYSYLIRSSSQCRQLGRKSTLQRRCLSLAKHQKTRFYILRRCVAMLMCWNDKYD
ncbi:hypothetical protein R6Q57_029220 [Mikania cordata]